MPRHIQTIVAIVVVAAWGASPIDAQQPAQPPVQGKAADHGGSQHHGMMSAGHDAGIMTGVHELFVGHAQLTHAN